jgi:hypothetical protein
MNSNQHLKRLKEKLVNQQMSVLIGAGFSMNVSREFPTWWKLIYDLTMDLYGREISDRYRLEEKEKNNLNKQIFYEEAVAVILRKVGYLEIVSQFIRDKGYNESITDYIEKRIPFAVIKGSSLHLMTDVNQLKPVDVVGVDQLRLHSTLLQLPWNNIYTTNYDNLLELSVDVDVEEKINKLIIETKTKIHELREAELIKQSSLESEKQNLSNFDLNNPDELDELLFGRNPSRSISAEIKDQLIALRVRIKQFESEIGGIEKEISTAESEVLSLEGALTHCLHLVTHSAQLALRRNKNIIKLHGSLRSFVERRDGIYGFDGNNHIRYIIAKEDFDSYPEKHEAFTQLMRISLLQESYCLIGFSGSDPNFIAWIRWVKDVIERKGANDNREIKIYLITFGNNDLQDGREVFYNNNRIAVIDLTEKTICNLLGAEEKDVLNRDYRKLLSLFFNYLSSGPVLSLSKLISENLSTNNYENSWSNLMLEYEKELSQRTIDTVATVCKNISSRTASLLHSLKNSSVRRKENLLEKLTSLITRAHSLQNLNFSQTLTDLAWRAFKETYSTYDAYLPEQQISQLMDLSIGATESKFELQMLLLRNLALRNNKGKFKKLATSILKKYGNKAKDKIIYEEFLHHSFNFEFQIVKEALTTWKPNQTDIIRKAAMTSMLDAELAERILKDYIKVFERNICQEQLLSLELHAYLEQSNTFSFTNKSNETIAEFKKHGVLSVIENLKYLSEEIGEFKVDTKPYGRGEFATSQGLHFSSENAQLAAVRYLQILCEYGLPLSLKHFTLRNVKEWYMIYRLLFERYPYPAVYYSLQYSDEDVLIRMGQDFAYSRHLVSESNDLCIKLLKAYTAKGTPLRFKKNSITFLAELYISVPPELWERDFHRVWKESSESGVLFAEFPYSNVPTALQKGLHYIKSETILNAILSDILENIDRNSNRAVSFTYQLAQNSRFELKKVKKNSKQYRQILKIITGSLGTKDVLLILGNIHQKLPADLLLLLRKKLATKNFPLFDSGEIWGNVLFFSGSQSKLILKIKKAIIESEFLWYSGIQPSGSIQMRDDHIRLSRIRKTVSRPNGLTWTNGEVLEIYDKLKRELKKIKSAVERRGELDLFKGLLREMNHFLINERKTLRHQRDYKNIINLCTSLYNKQKKFSDLKAALLSDDLPTLNWGLSELNDLLYFDDINKCKEVMELLFYRCVHRRRNGLQATLNAISFWCYDLKERSELKPFAALVNLILNEFIDDEFKDLKAPLIEEYLIKLAITLRYWQFTSEAVKYWLQRKNATRFNNVRSLK